MSRADHASIDRFEVLRRLGEGGMGRVVQARDPLLGRTLAVKTLLSPSVEARLRFTEEAQVTGQLSHPNIIPVHSFGVDEGTPYLAMRFVAGRDLKALVKGLAQGGEAEAYPLRRRLRLFLKVCEAIGHAHERGVVHRDLKPANVMLGEDDEVLVMDWGLARPYATAGAGAPRAPLDRAARLTAVQTAARAGGAGLTQEGAIVGTPAYMPPEQAGEDGVPDPRSDVYSLGALLYELLTHRPPYAGSTVEILSGLLLGAPPPPPRTVAPRHGIPAAVESIVLMAMSRELAGRYPDAGALAADVEAFLDERPVSCHDEGATEAVVRLVSRHRVPFGAAAIGLVLLAIAWAGAVFAQGQTADAARDRLEEAQRATTVAAERAARASDQEQRARLLAQSVAIASHGAAEVAEFATMARTAVRSDDLERRRDALARRLEALEQEVADLAGIDEAVRAEARAHLRASREALDLALLRALVARRPRKVTEPIARPDALPLVPGPELPLLVARAHARLHQPDPALAALAAAAWPADRPDLPLAARALELLVQDAPVLEQRAAVERALRAAPDAAWLLGQRASLHAREGELDLARQDYERSAALDPTDAFVIGQREAELLPPWVHVEFYANCALHHLAYSLAEQTDDWEFRIPHWQVEAWHMPHKYDVAVATLEQWKRERAVPLVRAACYQAQLSMLLQRWTVAEGFAREAAAAAPDDRRALGLLAEALMELGRHDEAKDIADRGLARHSTDGQLAYARGEVARRTGDFARGARWLEVGARRSMLAHRWERWARCLLELPDPASWEQGVQAMRTGLRYDAFDSWEGTSDSLPLPGDPQYHITLGDLRRKQGDLAAAALHYQRAQVGRETNRWANAARGAERVNVMRLGEVHEAMGLLAEAHFFYGQAREDPKLAALAARRMALLEGGR